MEMQSTKDVTLSPLAEPKATRGARVALLVVAAMAVALFALIGVRVKQANAKREQVASERQATQAAAQKRAPSTVILATPTTWTPRVELTGTLRPWREADIGFELGGRLVRLDVQSGAQVKAGQTLAVLDASRAVAEVGQAEAQARAAQANLALAEDNMRRTEALVASKSIPEAQAEQARQQVALMRAQLEGAQASARLARTGAGLHTITAPFAGVVTKAPTAAGGVVQPGAPLLRVEDLSRFRLSATVGEEEASIVKVGAPVDVVVRDRTVKGKVITLVPSLDQATRRAPVEIAIDNDKESPLLAYSFVRAIVAGSGEVPALRLPPAARRPGSQDEIVVVDGGKAKIVHVPHAVAEDGSWIVLRGLAPTDAVLLSPDTDVKDGDVVDVAK